jgi:hypothetical protein
MYEPNPALRLSEVERCEESVDRVIYIDVIDAIVKQKDNVRYLLRLRLV